MSLAASLPSRGAWIEILGVPGLHAGQMVAPLAGSVDRNIHPVCLDDVTVGGRSPRGERG